MENMKFKAVFKFSEDISEERKRKAIADFVALRNIAIGEINPKLERWNAEYSGPGPSEDDRLKDFGGTEYCKYIRIKMLKVIGTINALATPFGFSVILDVDEIGNIIARTVFGGIQINIGLVPMEN